MAGVEGGGGEVGGGMGEGIGGKGGGRVLCRMHHLHCTICIKI